MVKNLWKSGRAARNEKRRGDDEAFPSTDADYESVGAMLRKRREEQGEDLRYVAQILRIRYPYLKAIEDGRPDELPGPTYAVGFVRTYADHLGLDSDKFVHQFKAEAAGLQSRADLHFPAPLPEGKIPSGAVLVLAVVLAAAVYGAWIYLSSREQQVAEIVPQLPNRISEIIKGNPDAADAGNPAAGMTASTQPATPTPPAAEKPDAVPMAEKARPEETPGTTAGAAQSAPSPALSESGSAAPTQSPAVAGAGEQGSVATAAPQSRAPDIIPQPPGTGAESSESDVTPPPSIVTAPQEGLEGGNRQADGTGALSDADRAPPKVYGEENAGARIVIHAAADSWVEVRDSATDELLLTRVLFKGDKYRVPDRGGLTLLTGNAGGLRFVVDGANAPAIGPVGAVRRNVLLEPSALLAGSAGRPSDSGLGRTDSQTSDSGLQVQ